MSKSADGYVAWGVELLHDSDNWGSDNEEEWYNYDHDGKIESGEVYDVEKEWPLIEHNFAGDPDGETYFLVNLKRQSHVYYGSDELDTKALGEPSEKERKQLEAFLEWLEYKGDRTIKLLQWVNYG